MSTSGKWRFSFWPVLAFACALPLLIALGLWQLQRGAEKQAAYDAFDAAASGSATDMTRKALRDIDALPRYTRIVLRGRYLVERQFLLDNMPRHGRPGHHVWTPFLPEGAAYAVIVDRGWRPGRAQASDLPLAIDAASGSVRGMLAPLPHPALELQGDGVRALDWPRVVQFPEAGELAAALGRPVAQSRLLLDAAAPEGYEREWSAPGMPPARHYAYAFQWFALATALIAIFLFLAWPRAENAKE